MGAAVLFMIAAIAGAPAVKSTLALLEQPWRSPLRLSQMFLDLSFGRLVIRVRAVEAYAARSSGIVDVGADHVPPLAQVQEAVMALPRPALGRYANPFRL